MLQLPHITECCQALINLVSAKAELQSKKIRQPTTQILKV